MSTTENTTTTAPAAPAGLQPLHPIPAPWADELAEAAAADATFATGGALSAYVVPAPSAYALAAARAAAAAYGARLEAHASTDDHGRGVYAADGVLIGAVHTEGGGVWHAVNFLEDYCPAADPLAHDDDYPTPAAAVDMVCAYDIDNRNGFDYPAAR